MQKLSVRDRIMEAASRLFYFEGYNQTGINQIIEEAGVAKSSMYQTFRSKEEIAVAYLQQRHKGWMRNLDEAVAQETGVGKIAGAFDYLHQWLLDVEFRGCGFQNIITDLPKGQERIADQVRLHKTELQKWIFQVLEDADYGKRSESLSKECMVLIEGAIILSQIQSTIWPMETAKNACMKLLG